MATMTRARPTPARAQHFSRAKGAARDLSDLALTALGPAVAQLREARDGVQATTILAELVPAHMHAPLARYVVQHSNNFEWEIVAAVISFVGFEALARVTNENAAEAAFTRFVLPQMNATIA